MAKNSNYNIILGTSVTTKNAETQLNSLIDKFNKKKITLNINTNSFEKAPATINKYLTKTGTLITTVTNQVNANGEKIRQVIRQTTDESGNLVSTLENQRQVVSGNLKYWQTYGDTIESVRSRQELLKETFDELKNSSQMLTTETNKYVNKQGELVTRTVETTTNGQKLQTITREYLGDLGQAITATQNYVQVQGKWEKAGKAIINTVSDVKAHTETLTTKTQTLANGIKTLTTETISSNQAGQKTKTVVTETNDNLGRLTTTTSEYVQVQGQWVKQGQTVNTTIDKTNTGTKGLISTIVTATEKVMLFSVSTQLISLFSQAVNEAKQTILDFDAAVTEMKKVSDLSGESLNTYTQRLGELGEAVGRTRTQMVEASTEFLKSGYSTDDSANLAQIASLYQNIADSELSAGDSASYIISQMKAFGIEANDAVDIIDKTNEVSNNFAVSSTDISSALTKTSSSLASYGNDINETIGLITAGTEVMTGQASKVGRGLK